MNKMKKLLLIILIAVSFDAISACRSAKAVREFRKDHPCPVTGKKTGACHDQIVDHICALAQGGIDDKANMQWQTHFESKKKDRIENTPKGKAMFCNPSNSTPTRQVFNCK